ncbi:N-acetylmuramoyl-L-alanine amidase [Clostridium paraputrificum]|uniref:N-acetylmuramoyl-L-alanine amidase n=1 Tax=Clostridium paraputrificum TaxID=29363 RepID=UPI003D34E01C
MKIGLDMGHTLIGGDLGVQYCGLKEEDKTREIGKILSEILVQAGHTVVDCTVDEADSVEESLSARVKMANSNNVGLFISLHLNAYNGDARGVETHLYNDCSRETIDYAFKIQREICKLGYVDRGVKKGELYLVKHVSAPAIIIECGFIDNDGDMALFNAEAIAKGILTGIEG